METIEEIKNWYERQKKESEFESRTHNSQFQMSENRSPKLQGWAIIYNELSDNPITEGRFKEIILPGAFRESISKNDIRLFSQHDSMHILGRMHTGTLMLKDGISGLWFENTPPNTGWVRDLIVSIERGDINKMSFQFTINPGGERWEKRNGYPVRLLQSGRLYEISIVTFPVYKNTSVSVKYGG